MANWRLIPNTNNLYEVSDAGEVRRVEGFVVNSPVGGKRKVGGNILSQKTKRNGYKEVSLYISSGKGKMFYVHRLVASAFISPILDGCEVNHKDGNKSNNTIDNLEIVTPSENRIHAYYELGKKIKTYKGENHGMAKLKTEQVLKIRDLYKNGIILTKISEEMNIPFSTICKICHRKTWKHI